MGSPTLAVLNLKQDFLSSGGGRIPHSLLKIIMKLLLVGTVLFFVYTLSGLANASGSGGEAKGPLVTHTVSFKMSIGGEEAGTIKIGLFWQDRPQDCRELFPVGPKARKRRFQRIQVPPGHSQLHAARRRLHQGRWYRRPIDLRREVC